MTKETIRILLPTDKAPEDCEGTCEVEVGGLLGGAFIVTGENRRLKGLLQFFLWILEIYQGTLLS